jgi:hypothetical protein
MLVNKTICITAGVLHSIDYPGLLVIVQIIWSRHADTGTSYLAAQSGFSPASLDLSRMCQKQNRCTHD